MGELHIVFSAADVVGVTGQNDPRFGVAAHILGDLGNHCEVLGLDLELIKIE